MRRFEGPLDRITMSEPSQRSAEWARSRILTHVLNRRALITPDDVPEPIGQTAEFIKLVPESYRTRAKFFSGLQPIYSAIGSAPQELKFCAEPFHPLGPEDAGRFVRQQLISMGASPSTSNHGLAPISLGLVASFGFVAAEFAQVPRDRDLFLFDPLTGFLIWRADGRTRNVWLGNIRDVVEVEALPTNIQRLLLETRSDHFSLGRSIFTRIVLPRLKGSWAIRDDASDLPTLFVRSQAELDRLVESLHEACSDTPIKTQAVFRGQTKEHLMPDRAYLSACGVCPYSDVREHLLVPSLYRRYDEFHSDLTMFRSLLAHLLDWRLYADLLFGDPAKYLTTDRRVDPEQAISGNPTARVSTSFAIDQNSKRGLEGLTARSHWKVQNDEGRIVDEFIKEFHPARDAVRAHLVLQHYGAPTPFLDVTRSVRVAEWFATNTIHVDPSGVMTSSDSGPTQEAVIYALFVVDGLVPFVDTSELVSPDQALRPHRQSCGLIGGAGNLYRNGISRFVGLKIKFHRGFTPVDLPNERMLFPGFDEDSALVELKHKYSVPADSPQFFPVHFRT